MALFVLRGEESWTVAWGINFVHVKQKCLRTVCHHEIWGSHSDAAEESRLLGIGALPLGEWFQAFQRIMVPPSSHAITIQDPWRSTLECQKPLTQHSSIISQKTRILTASILESLIWNTINACNFISTGRLFPPIWLVIAISDWAWWSA